MGEGGGEKRVWLVISHSSLSVALAGVQVLELKWLTSNERSVYLCVMSRCEVMLGQENTHRNENKKLELVKEIYKY